MNLEPLPGYVWLEAAPPQATRCPPWQELPNLAVVHSEQRDALVAGCVEELDRMDPA